MKKSFQSNHDISFNKNPNKLNILSVIKERNVSRAELSRITGLTKPTVSLIVDELINDNLVFETDTEVVSNGRKPKILNFNSEAYTVIGMDFSCGTLLQIAEVDLNGKVLNLANFEDNFMVEPETAIKTIKSSLTDFFAFNVSNPSRIIGIGVSLPGHIDPENGFINGMSNFSWKNIPFSELLYQSFQLPVFIDNEANSKALAENILGSGKKYRNFVVIDLNYGVGMGIIIDNKLYGGFKNRSGEFGHMIIVDEGPLCRCGKRGCLEALIAPYTIKSRLSELISELSTNNNDVHFNMAKNEVALKDVIKAAYEGDNTASILLEEIYKYVSTGLASVINILSPEAIIIDGDFPDENNIFINSLKHYCSYSTNFTEFVDFVPSSFGEYSGVISSASLVINNLFSLKKMI